MRRPFALSPFVLGLSIAVSACGGTHNAVIPVDSPLTPWEAPEDLEPSDATAPAETPAEAPAPAAESK